MMNTDSRRGPATLAVAAIAAALSLHATPARAERAEPAPAQLDGVGITTRLDAAVPRDLPFVDETGRTGTLGRFFPADRPVVLTLNYYRCPMLCTLELNGLVTALKETDLRPARDFEIVTISIDPAETPLLARQKKQSYVESLGEPGAAEGWHFLTGTKESIGALASAVGFGYRYDDAQGQFAHPAAIFVLTPGGRISRVLSGVQFDPTTLRLALVEASHGRIGSRLDQFILYCYHFDAESGRYAPAALALMRLAGALTVLVLGAVVSALWIRERRGRRAA